jgi:predicted Zn-dependent peptidase
MIETTVLSSGMMLITERMPEVRSVSLGFWVGTGSRDERPGEEGISHFLEHLLFKGTPTRSARSIAEDTDAVGGDMNAYTTKEYTTFYMRLLGENLDLGLEILSDIMWNPALREEEVDAERQVILEEVLMHRDEPADVVYENLSSALFPNHPLGREVLGIPEVISSLSVAEIRQFLDYHYRPGNIVVSAAGDVDHEAIAEGLESLGGSRLGGEAPVREAPGATTSLVHVEHRDTEQAHLVLGMRTGARRDPRRYALSALNHALGGGLSSRLFQRVREERGLCYSIGSDRVAYADAGMLTVSVSTSPENVEETLSIILDELAELEREGISERELELAKGHLKADTLLSLEDSGSRMSRLGAGMLLQGEVITPDEGIARMEAVTREAVAEVAAEVFSAPRVLAVVGPFSADDFAGALNRT